MTFPARVLIGAVRTYQLTFASILGGQCRFTPTCSAYAMEALATHGALRGTTLAASRLLRCSPLCAGGHDPVPPYKPRPGTAPTEPRPATLSFSSSPADPARAPVQNPEAV